MENKLEKQSQETYSLIRNTLISAQTKVHTGKLVNRYILLVVKMIELNTVKD